MYEVLTAAQMRAIENAAMETGRCSGADLMERAGQGVVAALLDERPEFALTCHDAVVLCGPGNNGGDGFVIARLLSERGWKVTVLGLAPHGEWSGDAALMRAKLGEIADFKSGAIATARPEVLVDAVFGAGLSRDVELPLNEDDRRAMGAAYVVAVDGPSGLCLDTGKPRGEVVAADLTVSFDRPKLGHHLHRGPEHCGALRIVPIGLDEVANGWPETVTMVKGIAAAAFAKPTNSHKFNHGHVMVFGGGVGRGGAARLSARAALRIGAGLVTLAVPPAALQENAARLDAVMLKPMRGEAALDEILLDERLNAFCIGPGYGIGEATRAAVLTLCKAGRGLLLDADALRSFSGDPEELFDAVHARTVLTPHGGEFAALFPDIAERLTLDPSYSKVDATRDAAMRAGCVVLFKGPDTVIADQAGNVWLHAASYERAAPWLATAGSGDVLSGMIAGLLARGNSASSAACLGAWMHTECARRFGPGLIAEDLAEQIPMVLAALET